LNPSTQITMGRLFWELGIEHNLQRESRTIQKSLTNIEGSVDRVADDMRDHLSRIETSLEETTSRIKKLGGVFKTIKNILVTFGTVVVGKWIGGLARKGVGALSAFQERLYGLADVTPLTMENLVQLQGTIANLAKDMAITTESAIGAFRALYNVSDVSDPMRKSMGSMARQVVMMRDTMGLSLETAAQLTANFMNIYSAAGFSKRGIDKFTDYLFGLQRQGVMTGEELAGLVDSMKQMSYLIAPEFREKFVKEMAGAAGALKKAGFDIGPLQDIMQTLLTPSAFRGAEGNYLAAFLRLNMKEAERIGPVAVLKKLEERIEGISSKGMRFNLAQQLGLPPAFVEMLAERKTKVWKQVEHTIRASQGADIKSTWTNKMRTLSNLWDKFVQTWKSFAITRTVGGKTLLEWFGDALKEITKSVNKMQRGVDKIMSAFAKEKKKGGVWQGFIAGAKEAWEVIKDMLNLEPERGKKAWWERLYDWGKKQLKKLGWWIYDNTIGALGRFIDYFKNRFMRWWLTVDLPFREETAEKVLAAEYATWAGRRRAGGREPWTRKEVEEQSRGIRKAIFGEHVTLEELRGEKGKVYTAALQAMTARGVTPQDVYTALTTKKREWEAEPLSISLEQRISERQRDAIIKELRNLTKVARETQKNSKKENARTGPGSKETGG